MRILEVGPRDGLQNEGKTLTLAQREQLICSLLAAGMSDVEVGSFVKKEAIPQLEGTRDLVKTLLPIKKKKWPQAKLWAFVPNEIGLAHALEAGIDGVSFFSATSEIFAQKNVNRSLNDLKKNIHSMCRSLPKKIKSRAYLSTLVYCPFEGIIPPKKVFQWIDFLLECGVQDVSLSDTTGHAHPYNLKKIFDVIEKKYPLKNFSLHYHDTRGTALLNTYFALDYGFTNFDSSLGGAGGCPYAPRATGNLATEDLLYLMHARGKFKNISLEKVAAASFELEKQLGKQLPSKFLQTLRKP